MVHPLQRLREQKNLSIRQLAKVSRISATSIKRIEQGSCYKTTYAVADALAKTLGVPMGTLFDVHSLSDDGRPAFTGTPFSKKHLKASQKGVVCPECGMETPATRICDEHGRVT